MRSGRRADPLLLWEVGLLLVLIALFLVLFFRPAAQQPFRPYWFSGPLLAAGLFGLLLLDRRRKRRRERAELREVLDEAEAGSIRDENGESRPG